VVECRRVGEIPAAIGPGAITLTRRLRAGLFCAFLAPLAVAPLQALAQTVSTQTEPAGQTSAATPSGPLVPPVSPAELPFLGTGAVDIGEGYPAGTLRGTSTGQPGILPPFLLDGYVDLAEGYTTNAHGTSPAQPDTFTRGRFGLGLHYASARLRADAHYSLTGDLYNRFSDLDQLSNQLNFAATSVLIPEHLFFNVNAFAAPAVLSRVGSLSANSALVSDFNNRNSYGYVAEPVLTFRLGDYAISQTSLSERGVFFAQPSTSSTGSELPTTSAENTTVTRATERILSQPYFGRLLWGLTGSYSDTNQTTQSVQQSEATVGLAYALDRVVAVVATAGYRNVEASVPLTQSLSGPIALAGVRLSYGPTFNLVAGGGVSSGFPTYLGSLDWNLTPTFAIVGSLTDTIGTPQGGILNTLSTLAVSADGSFSNSQSYYWQNQEQALFPQFATVSPIPTLGLALDNSINHDRSARLAFIHHDERTEYGLSFFGDTRDRLNVTTETIPSNSWVYGVGFNVSRKLRRDLTGYAGATYSVANEFGGQDRIITIDGGLTYMLAKDLDCYLTGQYLQRESSGQIITNVPLSDFVAIVGIRRKFGH
jgi:uncharacterized protein (PEP-CTERM system associated)